MSDFVSNEVIEIDVLGRIFKFKELLGGEMDKMRDKATKFNPETGEVSYLMSNQNSAFLACVTDAPYLEWKGLKTAEEKLKFLNKLKDPIRMGLIGGIAEHHRNLGGAGDVVKK